MSFMSSITGLGATMFTPRRKLHDNLAVLGLTYHERCKASGVKTRRTHLEQNTSALPLTADIGADIGFIRSGPQAELAPR